MRSESMAKGVLVPKSGNDVKALERKVWIALGIVGLIGFAVDFEDWLEAEAMILAQPRQAA